jgi:hypothetical protein
MREKVEDRDSVPSRGSIGKIVFDGVFDFQLATFLKEHDASGRELLPHRAQAEFRVRSVRRFRRDIGKSIAFVDEHLAVASHQDATHELARRDLLIDCALHP